MFQFNEIVGARGAKNLCAEVRQLTALPSSCCHRDDCVHLRVLPYPLLDRGGNLARHS